MYWDGARCFLQNRHRDRFRWVVRDHAYPLVRHGTTVYLPVELAERLRRYAFERDTKQNAIMTEAIATYLDAKGA